VIDADVLPHIMPTPGPAVCPAASAGFPGFHHFS